MMIVEFTKIDSLMEDLFHELVFKFSHSFDPLLSKIETHKLHEGKHTSVIQGNKVYKSDLQETRAEHAIPFERNLSFNFDDFVDMAQNMAKQFLPAKQKLLFETMRKVTTETGNIVDGRGKPLSHDTLLRALELLPIEFDEDDKPRLPSLVISPALAPTMEKLSKESEEDPKLKRRFDKLMAKKLEEFRAREADRKLVG